VYIFIVGLLQALITLRPWMLGKSRICIICPYNRFLFFLEPRPRARPCWQLHMMEQICCELSDGINPAWVQNRGIILNQRVPQRQYFETLSYVHHLAPHFKGRKSPANTLKGHSIDQAQSRGTISAMPATEVSVTLLPSAINQSHEATTLNQSP
jgi:hypothetical protein